MSITSSEVAVTIANPEMWPELLDKIHQESGFGADVTMDTLVSTLTTAIPLFFNADKTGSLDSLLGVFTNELLSKLASYFPHLEGVDPVSAEATLISTKEIDSNTSIRVHLVLTTTPVPKDLEILKQFWDLLIDAEVTVSDTVCSKCGTTLGLASSICENCGTDTRKKLTVPLAVSHISLY
jgi:hypothetical protein